MSRPITHSLVKALRAVPVFAPLDDAALLRVVGASANLHWPAGATVFDTGAQAEALYVVLSGQVQILDMVDGGAARAVATVGPGDYFGEHSLLLDVIHSKTAIAGEPTELMVVPSEAFKALLAGTPEVEAAMRQQLEARLASGGPPL